MTRPWKLNKSKIKKLSATLTTALNFIVLSYLIVFCVAQPQPALITAIAMETVYLAALLLYRNFKSKTKSAIAMQSSVELLKRKHSLFDQLNTLSDVIVVLASAAILLFAAVDLTALVSADLGNLSLSRSIYCLTAPPVWTGLQPAFSLEILAGALLDAKKFSTAERLEMSLLEIRKGLVGEKHELIAAAYCDLGDFYRRDGQLSVAENYYRQAIELATALNYARGYGRPMTQLGCTLRDEHKYKEAEQAFTKALAIRERLFGINSLKVAETLKEFAVLEQMKGDTKKVEIMKKRYDAIFAAEKRRNSQSGLVTVAPVVVILLSLAFFALKDKILIYWAKQTDSKGI